MTEPARNVPLTAEDVKLLVRGDWLTLDGEPVRFAHATEAHIMADGTSLLPLARFTFLARPADPNDPEGWVAHDGGENPAPGMKVETKHANGRHDADSDSDSYWWDRKDLPGDITHWRPQTPAPAGECVCPKPTPLDTDGQCAACYNPSPASNGDEGAVDDEEEAYHIGKRDGYEQAIQDLDLATGGDGEFKATTHDGVVDVPVMKARIVDRFPVDAWAGYCRQCGTARKAEPCQKCGAALSPLRPDHEEPRLPDVGRIRSLAREVGYAIGVHGSLERDLDIIAIPWAEGAVSAPDLAAHLAVGLDARVLDDKVQDKPLGRWSCNIQIDGWFKVIDLSVMPALSAHQEREARAVAAAVRLCLSAKENSND